jgi:cytochrome P450
MKQGLSVRDCEVTGALLVPAGAETTTTAIRGILLYLITAPTAYQKLKAEIADGIKAGLKAGLISSPITQDDSRKLPYLQICLSHMCD